MRVQTSRIKLCVVSLPEALKAAMLAFVRA